MKIHPAEAKLFYLDRQTDKRRDMMKLTVCFSQFCATLLKSKRKWENC
jgi:hypothetical protein